MSEQAERRTPRAADDLFWFLEAKRAYAQLEAAERREHGLRGLYFGACAARTEIRVELAAVRAQLVRLQGQLQREHLQRESA